MIISNPKTYLLTRPSFGYDTGQISGFLGMPNFLQRFGQFNTHTQKYYFSNVRSGLIVAMVSRAVPTLDIL